MHSWATRDPSHSSCRNKTSQFYTNASPGTAAASTSTDPATTTLSPGTLVALKNNLAEPLIGVITGPAPGNKPSTYSIKDQNAQSLVRHLSKLDCVFPPSSYSSSSSSETIQQILSESHPLLDPSLVTLAWEVSEPSDEISLPDMADLLYNRRDTVACVAAYTLLADDQGRMYFKTTGRIPSLQWQRRSEDEVKILRREVKLKRLEEQGWMDFDTAVKEAEAIEAVSAKPSRAAWLVSPHAHIFTALENYLMGRINPSVAEGSALLKKVQKAVHVTKGAAINKELATTLLKSTGFWPPHVQTALLAAGIYDTFSPELEAAAEELLKNPPPDPDAAIRKDLRQGGGGEGCQRIITIDDAGTTEIDDALSIEQLPDGRLRCWVHIADPTRWLGGSGNGGNTSISLSSSTTDDDNNNNNNNNSKKPSPATVLEREAAKRVRTIYLPTGPIRMFPASLAEGPFSLREQEDCYALSLAMTANKDGSLDHSSIAIIPTLIRVDRKLTYDDVDEMLVECSEEEEGELHRLARLSEMRKRYRREQGAVEINLPEMIVDVEGEEGGGVSTTSVSISTVSQSQSAARSLVGEAMIMAGEAVGIWGEKMQVPLPYRGQNAPVLPEEEELEAVPPGPCRAALLRTRMTRSITLPGSAVPHAGLGLPAYVQVTSPIRRYGDLLAHKQLKAVLRGEQPPLTPSLLGMELDIAADRGQELNKVERGVTNFWVGKYFQQSLKLDPGASWEALFLVWHRQETGMGKVLLEELGLESFMKFDRPAVPGEKFRVTVDQLDVESGIFRLAIVNSSRTASAAEG